MQPSQLIHFIDTGYHFPETLAYKQQLVDRWNLRVVDLHPDAEAQARTRHEQWWVGQPDRCCAVNKVKPLDAARAGKRVWMSGLMGFQNTFRAGLQVFEEQGDLLKFHPLIDLKASEYREEMERHQIPCHPLEKEGYDSIGCHHCTRPGKGRNGRWQGSDKTECGLHTAYLEKRLKDKSNEP